MLDKFVGEYKASRGRANGKRLQVLGNFRYVKLMLARFSSLVNILVKDVAKFKHIWCKKPERPRTRRKQLTEN